jgi:hypothetical protein
MWPAALTYALAKNEQRDALNDFQHSWRDARRRTPRHRRGALDGERRER